MKQYEYVSVHIGKLFGATSEEHREIINDYAAKGWRYVGFIPTNMNDYGKLKDIDLIFETGYEVVTIYNHLKAAQNTFWEIDQAVERSKKKERKQQRSK